ncbi:MAG: hypothetical protein ACMVY4_21285 [Minwuia sp.]|uniref:hypothetical protein n=1 Tax=Minwuia sp. TaxID=2493630 RepID=UPI003A897743
MGRLTNSVTMKMMRDIQPVVASFAVIAMVLHAAFWVSCALQFPPGTVKISAGSLLVPICTPDGVRTVEMDFGRAGAPVDGEAMQECPACALVCGVDAAPGQTGFTSPVGLAAALPPAIVEAEHRARLIARTGLVPRAPPAVFSTA